VRIYFLFIKHNCCLYPRHSLTHLTDSASLRTRAAGKWIFSQPFAVVATCCMSSSAFTATRILYLIFIKRSAFAFYRNRLF
jgi:hypothetical protein